MGLGSCVDTTLQDRRRGFGAWAGMLTAAALLAGATGVTAQEEAGAPLRLTLHSGAQVEGTLAGRPDSMVTLRDGTAPHRVLLRDIARIDQATGVGRRTGEFALYGLGIGVGAGLLTGIALTSLVQTACVITAPNETCGNASLFGPSILVGGLMGVVIGAGLGWPLEKTLWSPIRPSWFEEPVRLTPIVAPDRLGLAVQLPVGLPT